MSKEQDNKQNEQVEEAEQQDAVAAEKNDSAENAPVVTAEELSALLQKLDQATAEINMQKERYLRGVADLENYRKRAVREKEEARKQAIFGLVEDLLPVLDNFRLGLKSAEDHEGGAVFAEGFRMILTQMEGALKQNGLEEINPGNELFDPNYHESIAHHPHETVADGHIIEVHRTGYKINERLLRPAQVIVSSGQPEKSEQDG